MTAYVFLGPSLSISEASSVFDATYLPPVQQGDVLRLLRQKPRMIGIVDGYFDGVPAVWHKEILFALNSGVHVFGAASMGALRAAELHTFGMIGIGKVFEWYRDGVILSDDEVAVSHGPRELDYIAVNDTLVDIRDTCLAAVDAGLLTAGIAGELVALGKAMHYHGRSFDAVAAAYRGEDDESVARWLSFAKHQAKGVKARDTLALLEAMRTFAGTDPAPKRVGFCVERSVFFERLRNEVALEATSKDRELPAAPTVTGSPAVDPRQGILLRILARQTSEMLGWQLGVEEVNDYARRFCVQHGLTNAERLRRWLADNSLSEQALRRFLSDGLLIERLERLHSVQVDEELAEHTLMLSALESSNK